MKAGKAPESDLFTDVYAEFKKDLPEKEAVEKTWVTMALLATGGPNYRWRSDDMLYIGDDNPTMVKIFKIIAQSLPLLSHWGRGSGSYYGLPKGVNVDCDNGKHYHFWMSAYLAWKAVQLGHTKTGSSVAAFTIFKGYTYISRSGAREPHRGFSLDSFHGYNNTQRIDIAYSAAGVRFAINFMDNKKDKKIDLDKAVVEMFKNSEDSENMTEAKAQSYMVDSPQLAFLAWMNRFSPDTPYNVLVKGN